jgi:lipopolysaccharide transport system permease protein
VNVGMLAQRLELLYLLVLKDIRVRYKSSVLGYLWAVINPFAFAFVYWLAFKFVMRVEMDNYSVFLIAGMFPWIWLSSGVTQATRSYQSNSWLVKRINLNRSILPLSSILQEMVHFLFALPVLAAFVVFAGGSELHWSWCWQVPCMVLVQLAFSYPLGLTLSLLNVFVHDIEYLVGIAFSLLFFATPIVYPITMVPSAVRFYFELSPLHSLIDSWRGVILHGTLQPQMLTLTVGYAVVLCVIASIAYKRLAPRIAEVL